MIMTLDMKIQDLYFLKAQITANVSRSVVDQRDWVGDSFMLAKAMGFSMSSSDHCIRQQPMAIELASVENC